MNKFALLSILALMATSTAKADEEIHNWRMKESVKAGMAQEHTIGHVNSTDEIYNWKQLAGVKPSMKQEQVMKNYQSAMYDN